MNSYVQTLAVVVASISLGACSVSAGPAVGGTQMKAVQTAPFGGPLVYVADAGSNVVYVFPAGVNNPAPVAKIAGFKTPDGLAVDADGNLFVANTNGRNVLAFKAGTTTLLRTLTYPSSAGPISLAFNPVGVLFAVNSRGFIAEYQPGSSSPSQTIDISQTTRITTMGQIAFDSGGNLYAALVPQLEKPAHVFKFAPGAKRGIDMQLEIRSNSTEPGLAIDSKGDLYVGNYADVDVFASGSRKPTGRVGGTRSPNIVGFLTVGNSGDVYVARRDTVGSGGVIDGFVLEFGPGGAPFIAKISKTINPIATAVSSAAPR